MRRRRTRCLGGRLEDCSRPRHQCAAQRGPADIYALSLPQQLAQVRMVDSSVSGARQVNDAYTTIFSGVALAGLRTRLP